MWWRKREPVKPTTEQLIHALGSPDESVRFEAARQLSDPAAVCRALDQEERSWDFPSPTVPLLIDVLARIGGPQAERHLTSLLLKEKYWRREQGDLDWSPASDWVMPALVELGGADLLLRALLDALTDSWPDTRKHAADEFANIAYRATIDDEGWTGHDDEPITELHRAAMVDALCLSLNDTDSRVRYSAALALGDLGDVRAIEPLRRRGDDPEIWRPVQEALTKLAQR